KPGNLNKKYTASHEGKVVTVFAKPSRNDPYPCGSGLKFKKYPGRIDRQRDETPAEEPLSKRIVIAGGASRNCSSEG
ncbi:MAG TPA: SEC-C metal-binding domain-containing protein, partial [Methanothrix sp.]|nr:SEC-C metal-binding domain-containing protein [Methanothrix sp.]